MASSAELKNAKKPAPKGGRTKPKKSRDNKKTSDFSSENTNDDNDENEKPNGRKSLVPYEKEETKETKDQETKFAKYFLEFVSQIEKIGVAGFQTMYQTQVAALMPPSLADAHSFTANPERNRYMDIVCLEATRVILKHEVPPATDYIHANWICFDNFDRKFIATQSPLENTQNDFWRMIFQEEVPSIVNLNKLVEDNKIKGSQYWPKETGEVMQCGSISIINKKTNKDADKEFSITVLEVLPDGCSNSWITRLFCFHNWPDHAIPSGSGRSVLRLIRCLRKEDVLATGPVVLHCSAGVGRTGCVMLVDIVLNWILMGKQIDFVEVVKSLRGKRASVIQTESQFLFAIVLLLQYAKAKYLRSGTDAQRVKKLIDAFGSVLR